MEALAKSYADLEKSFAAGGAKVPAKPEAYDLTIPEGSDAARIFKDGKAEGDPLVSWFRTAAHEAGLNQKAAAQLFAGFVETVGKIAPPPMNLDAEIKALGPNGRAIHDTLMAKARHFVDTGVFTDAERADFEMVIGAREGMTWMSKLLDALGDRTIPARIPGEVTGAHTKEELYAMVKKPEYRSDVAYRNKVNKLFEDVFGDEPAGTSPRMG